MTTIIRGGLVLGAGRAPTSLDILIEGEEIRAVGPPGMSAPPDATVMDAGRRLVMPGLVNAHTHSHYNMGKGLGDRWTLELLLNAAPGVTGGMTQEDLYLSTLLGAMEMVRKGCTAAYDLVVQLPAPTVETTDAIGRAYAAVGMRAVIAFQMADDTFWRTIPGLVEAIPEGLRERVTKVAATPWRDSIAGCRRVIDAWPCDGRLVRPAIAPTIPLLCSDPFLQASCALAREHGLGLHTHLAESKVQAVVGKARYGKSLTAHLDALGYLGPHFTAAHAIWLDEDDIRRLAGNGCSVAHNPGSNLRLGNGIAPASAMRAAGLTVGIGTDAAACSDHLNMFEAMRLAALSSRATTPDPDGWLGSPEVFAMATVGGAKSAGLDGCGRIEAGAKADLVLLDLDNLNYVPLNDALNQLVNCENGAAVDSVMVGGRMVLERGSFTNIDEKAVIRQVEAANARLRQRNTPRRQELAALDAIVGQFCVGLAKAPHHVHRYVGAG